MPYCDHKCIYTCPDCINEIVKLRKRIKELEYNLDKIELVKELK